MTTTRKMTFDLPEDIALEIDAQVASGAYTDQNSVVVDSLLAHLDPDRDRAGDPEIEGWLRDEVGPTYDRWKRENTPGIPIDEVFAGLKARREARKHGT